MKNRFSLRLKLNIISFAILLLGGIIVSEFFIHTYKKNSLNQTQKELQTKLKSVKDFLYFYKMSDQGIKKFDDDLYIKYKEYISGIELPGNSEIVIFNRKGDVLIHPTDEGRNLSQEFHIYKILSSNIHSNVFFFTSPKDLRKKIVQYSFDDTYAVYICIICDWDTILLPLKKETNIFRLLLVVVMLVIIFILDRIFGRILKSLQKVSSTIEHFTKTDYEIPLDSFNTGELFSIKSGFSSLKDIIEDEIKFADDISNGKLDTDFNPVNNNDRLGHSLLHIRDNMKSAQEEQERRKIEDEKQNWVNVGLANFSDLLRMNNDDLKKHSDVIIQNLVKYINANQGALFIINESEDDSNNKYLELASAFAYDTKKFIEKKTPVGEGLIGTCAIEKRTILLTEVPDDYIEITSGLGDAPPRCILIVPIKMEDEVLGVLEVASFKVFGKHEIDFVERIMESVASTLSSAKINAQTSHLLKRFEMQNEQMKSQEEEMRQNMEEMQAVQEDAEKVKAEMTAKLDLLGEIYLFCEYFADGKTKSINNKFANFFGFELNEVIRGNIDDHIRLGFLKSESDQTEILNALDSQGRISFICNYNISGKIFILEEIFITIKDEYENIKSILRMCNDRTLLRDKEDEITSLITREHELIDELNQAKEEIKTLEENLKK